MFSLKKKKLNPSSNSKNNFISSYGAGNFNSMREESELTMTRLVSQSKLSKGLEERGGKKMNGGVRLLLSPENRSYPSDVGEVVLP